MLERTRILPDAARARWRSSSRTGCASGRWRKSSGRRMFWGRWFGVTREVLDPRPETETLVAAALAGPAPGRILDLGTGSGAILLTLLAEWPEATGVGTDAARRRWRRGGERRGATGWRRGRSSGSPTGGGARRAVRSGGQQPALHPGGRDRRPCAGRARLGAAGALTPGPSGLESYRRIAAGSTRRCAEAGGGCSRSGRGRAPRWQRSSGRQGSGRFAFPRPRRPRPGRRRRAELTASDPGIRACLFRSGL